MKKTKTQLLAAWLELRGSKEVPSKSKYRKFTRPGRTDFYFLGKSGALRVGINGSTSISLTHRIPWEKINGS